MKNKTILGTICGIMTGICWSLSGVFAQFLFETKGLQANLFIPIRLFVAGVILFLYMLFTNHKELFAVTKNKKDFIQTILSGIFGTMLFQSTFFKAVEASNAGTATVLQYLAPVFIMFYVCLKKNRFPNRLELLSIFLAVGGVFLISTHGDIRTLSISPDGLFWGLACAFGMFTDTLLPEKLNKKYSAIAIMAWSFLFGGIVAMFVFKPWNYPLEIDFIVLGALLVTILLGCITAYLLYRYSIKTIGPSKASLFSSSELISATILSVCWLGTPLMWVDFVGFTMILFVVFILTSEKQNSTT